MVCPYLINTITETSNKNAFADSKRTETKTFGKCVGEECPFFNPYSRVHCTRVDTETAVLVHSK